MTEKIDRLTLQKLFLEAMNGTGCLFIEGCNPFSISLDGKDYWIYIKNLTSAHFENPDVWRAQLPQRNDFEQIKNSNTDFILLGYDGERDVYATWNPLWVKQRLNSTGNVSFYSRLSLQLQASHENKIKRLRLNNDGEIIVFPRGLTKELFSDIQSHFLAQGNYVAIGSKRRPEANEAFKTFYNTANISRFSEHLESEGKPQNIINDYCRTVKTLLTDGTITRNRKIFYAYDTLDGYKNALDKFLELNDVKKADEACLGRITMAFKAYLDFLAPQPHNEAPADNENSDFSGTSEDIIEQELPLEHDWEAEYTDADGKLTRIANPKLIDLLRPYLDIEYKKTAAALNIIEKFYGDRFPNMEFADWRRLLNDIDWSAPYNSGKTAKSISSNTPKRIKRHTLRVEFQDGRIFQNDIVSDTYAAVIKEIGPELVELVGLSHSGVEIVSKTIDQKYGKYQKPIGEGWYVMTNSSTERKCSDLQALSVDLELGLKVSLIPLNNKK